VFQVFHLVATLVAIYRENQQSVYISHVEKYIEHLEHSLTMPASSGLLKASQVWVSSIPTSQGTELSDIYGRDITSENDETTT